VIRLIIFDLDGTLIDSSTDLANAANALLGELGGDPIPEDRIVGMIGEGAGVLVQRALTAAGLDPVSPGALDRFLALYDERLLDHTVPYDGIIDALESIAGAGAGTPLAVLTNKPAHAAERVLEGLNLRHYFRDVIGGDTAFGRKPDPAGLFHLAATAAVPVDTTLLVGDSPIDLETARRSGARVCLARYGFGYRFTDSDFRGDELFIDDPLELIRLVGRPRDRAL
jgi:phosphoglycolate phosphatase